MHGRPLALGGFVLAACLGACTGATSTDVLGPPGPCERADCDATEPEGSAGAEADAATSTLPAKDAGAAQTDGGGAHDAAAPQGPPCDLDEDCDTGICNWKTDRCASPSPVGSACGRDRECKSQVCNWKTDRCAAPGAKDAPCGRDSECLSGVCLDGDVCR